MFLFVICSQTTMSVRVTPVSLAAPVSTLWAPTFVSVPLVDQAETVIMVSHYSTSESLLQLSLKRPFIPILFFPKVLFTYTVQCINIHVPSTCIFFSNL